MRKANSFLTFPPRRPFFIWAVQREPLPISPKWNVKTRFLGWHDSDCVFQNTSPVNNHPVGMVAGHTFIRQSKPWPERDVLSSSLLPSGCQLLSSICHPPSSIPSSNSFESWQLLMPSVTWVTVKREASLQNWQPIAPSAVTFALPAPQNRKTGGVLWVRMSASACAPKPTYRDSSPFFGPVAPPVLPSKCFGRSPHIRLNVYTPVSLTPRSMLGSPLLSSMNRMLLPGATSENWRAANPPGGATLTVVTL